MAQLVHCYIPQHWYMLPFCYQIMVHRRGVIIRQLKDEMKSLRAELKAGQTVTVTRVARSITTLQTI